MDCYSEYPKRSQDFVVFVKEAQLRAVQKYMTTVERKMAPRPQEERWLCNILLMDAANKEDVCGRGAFCATPQIVCSTRVWTLGSNIYQRVSQLLEERNNRLDDRDIWAFAIGKWMLSAKIKPAVNFIDCQWKQSCLGWRLRWQIQCRIRWL